jgi:magnesium chelatase family protein
LVSTVSTVAYLGLDARSVEVQCQLVPGLPNFIVVGLPDKAVAESRERVRNAIAAIGLSLPPKRITVNLSPADLPKEGSHFDLPIAFALLGAMGVIDAETLAGYVVVGELGRTHRLDPGRPARRSARRRTRTRLGVPGIPRTGGGMGGSG